MRLLIAIFAMTASQSVFARDCVVVLHGLGRTSFSMSSIANSLEQNGYDVVSESYPSRKGSVSQLVHVVGDGVEKCKKLGASQIHFVTHSLGGILVRAWFQDHVVPEARRVVMLAPPNHGSEIVDAHARKWWYRHSTGPAGQELGTGDEGLISKLGEIPLEIGVIAGTRSMDPWFASVMPEPNDGKVSVASTKLAEMRDFVSVPYAHTFIARRSVVAAQVLSFLAEGKFNHDVKSG